MTLGFSGGIMKKCFMYVALLSILSGGAFAQVSLGGNLFAGVAVDIPYEGEESIGLYNRENEAKNSYMDLYVNALFGKGLYGAKLDTNFTTPDSFTVKGIYGWANLFNSQIRLSVGRISDGVWVTSLDNEYTFDEVTGARIEYRTPLKGLSVGIALDAGDYTFEKFAKQLIFGGSYVSALFNTVFAYDLGSNARTLFGFNFTGIDNLTTAGIELQASDLALWDKMGAVVIDEEVAYRIIRPLTVSLHLTQKFYGSKDEELGLAFRPGIAYRIIQALTGSLELEVNTEDAFKTSNLVITPCLEYRLPGAGMLYLQYDLTLTEFTKPSHLIGLGFEIKAF
jgi:hypothetical protein